jgi:putative lipase involved disintegration of autophagic bodies
MSKYTFVEFIAALEGDDFNVIEPSNLKWAKDSVESMGNISDLIHLGDCTKQNISCPLCVYEIYLKEYREYYFKEQDNAKQDIS